MQPSALRITLLLFAIACIVVGAWLAFWPSKAGALDPTPLELSSISAVTSDIEPLPTMTSQMRRDDAESEPTAHEQQVDVAPHLHLRFLRGGEPAAGRAWAVSGTAVDGQHCDIGGLSSADGISHLALAPGAYTLTIVPLAPWQSKSSQRMTFGPNLPFAPTARTQDFIVRDADYDQWVDVALAPGTLALRALDAASLLPIPDTTFYVRSESEERMVAELRSDAEGRALLLEFEAGAWIVEASAAHHQLMSAAAFEINELTPRHAADLLLQPTATLRVRLLDEAGAPIEISRALRLQVRSSTGEAARASGSTTTAGRQRPHELLFAHLRGDRYEIRLHEEELESDDERSVRFQPVDCAAPLVIDAPAGTDTRADLRVRYRAYTRLKCEHPELASLVVRPLQWDPDIKRALTGPWQHGTTSGGWHFDGYLAPGAYDIVLTHTDGRQWVERLQVERTPIERIFAPTWDR